MAINCAWLPNLWRIFNLAYILPILRNLRVAFHDLYLLNFWFSSKSFLVFFFSLFFSTHANAQNTATFYRQISFDRIEQSTHTFAHQSSRMKWFTHALHVPRIIEFDLRKLGMIPIWMCIRCDTTFTQYAVKQSARFIPYTKTISSHLIDFCNRKCLFSATAFLFWSTEIYLVCWKMKHLWLTLVRRRSAVENHKRIRMWRVCSVLKRTFLRRMAMEWNRNA